MKFLNYLGTYHSIEGIVQIPEFILEGSLQQVMALLIISEPVDARPLPDLGDGVPAARGSFSTTECNAILIIPHGESIVKLGDFNP